MSDNISTVGIIPIRDAVCGTALKPPLQQSPLVLAYIGDTVYDLFVRASLVCSTDNTAHALHMLATKYVRASAQSYAYRAIEDMLTDDEKYIFRRGRNAHPATVPKNADVGDYRTATGFEALLGYLYLSCENERLCEIAQRAIKCIEESMKDGEKNGLRKQ